MAGKSCSCNYHMHNYVDCSNSGRYDNSASGSAIADWALEQPGVKCIAAETEVENIASQKVLTKAGFIPTGEVGAEGPLYVRSDGTTEISRMYIHR